jgi:hemerythrin-like domain-containing protein
VKATEILMDEHRVIERVLGVLEIAARRAARGDPVRPDLFLEAADFIMNFADGSHHRKEEGVLFKVMVDAGMPLEGGPIAVMLSEHEQARAYTRSLREAAERWQQGDDLGRQQTAQAATSYAMLLRQHIAKEDRILFPMADQAIPPTEHSQILADFTNVESEEERAAVYAKYTEMAESLEREIESDGNND